MCHECHFTKRRTRITQFRRPQEFVPDGETCLLEQGADANVALPDTGEVPLLPPPMIDASAISFSGPIAWATFGLLIGMSIFTFYILFTKFMQQQKIIKHLGEVTPDEIAFVRREFETPLDAQGFVRSVPRGMEQEVYAKVSKHVGEDLAEHYAGADVSREGVQRDLLPLVEGCTVSTRYGMVKTDHILFIASGAFHLARPSDLIPELQGRLPIRVELRALEVGDFTRILTEPQASLTQQYTALMATEGVELHFGDDGVRRIAEIAWQVNEKTENIGARRLHTVMERLLEEVSFMAPTYAGRNIVVDAGYVDRNLSELAADEDLTRYIL